MILDIWACPPLRNTATGEEVLLLHGWGVGLTATWPRWRGAQRRLPGDGAGLPRPRQLRQAPGDLGRAGYARWVGGVMEAWPWPQTVIAHSFGSRVALWLAAREPRLVRHLVLTGQPA